MHAGGLARYADTAMAHTPTTSQPAAGARFSRLLLLTQPLADMARFYRETLGLPVRELETNHVGVTAGDTVIEFSQSKDNTQPYYHFAFNIPHNKIEAAIKWMDGRASLIKRADGEAIFHFPSWDADAIYFLDPAGNIVEFIARHTLKNDAPGDFTVKDILYASEIGVVAPDVPQAARTIRDSLALSNYKGESDAFTAVGDEHGLFIVVKTGRKWFNSDREAEVFDALATLGRSNAMQAINLADSRFTIAPRYPSA